MITLERINCIHFSDAKLFLRHLRELKEEDPGRTFFRGQTKDWPLIPTACRDNNPWSVKWIEGFVNSHNRESTRFFDYRREQETVEDFQSRFQLALRHYIESEIIYQFQQLATTLGLIDLSPVERVTAADPRLISDYLSHDTIPLAGNICYAPLLAQHHEVPTRLLDWTSSLDVAIDFALDGVSDSTGRIVVWTISEWDRKVRSADPDCDEQHLTATLSATGHDSARPLMDVPLHGTCLKLYTPPNKYMNDMYITQLAFISEDGVRQDERCWRVKIDRVQEVYVDEQEGNAMIDMWHDRHVYKYKTCQPIEARLSASPIPKNTVYKFTLPYSEIPYLEPQPGDFKVKRLYDHEMYAQFDNENPPSDSPIAERRRVRKCNFLSMLGKRVKFEIDWDGFGI